MKISAQHLAEIVENARKSEGGGRGSDKRRFSRFPVVAKVDVLNHSLGNTYAALTRDLSLEGMGLLQSVSMAAEEQFSVSLPRGKHGPLVVRCVVKHTREMADGVWGIGATFVSVASQALADAGSNAKAIAAEAQRIAAKMLD
jgi:hypothetical protein